MIAALILALALPQSAPNSADVVVTGRREKQTAAQAAKALTRAVTVMTDGQVARFADQVCPGVVGLPAPHDRTVADRIADDARAAGLSVGRPGCTPNVTVVLTENGRALIEALPPAALPPGERRRLLADHGPVHVFAATQLRSRDGDQVGTSPNGLGKGSHETRFLLVRDASIINAPVRQDLVASVVILDRPATIGKTLRQIADYAALRALARTAPAPDPARPTILTLFTPGAATPSSMTGFDTAYLRAIYTGQATAHGLAKVGAMGRHIAKATEAQEP